MSNGPGNIEAFLAFNRQVRFWILQKECIEKLGLLEKKGLKMLPLRSDTYNVMKKVLIINCYTWIVATILYRRKTTLYIRLLMIIVGAVHQDPGRSLQLYRYQDHIDLIRLSYQRPNYHNIEIKVMLRRKYYLIVL